MPAYNARGCNTRGPALAARPARGFHTRRNSRSSVGSPQGPGRLLVPFDLGAPQFGTRGHGDGGGSLCSVQVVTDASRPARRVLMSRAKSAS
jgi:hypothetical protein